MPTLSHIPARPTAEAFEAVADEHLMLLLKSGDVRAYEALVTRHRGAVASIARFTCGADLADDVTQIALVALWQQRDKYHPDRGSPRSWLLGIARNRGIDQLRSHSARQRHTVCMDPQGWVGIADRSAAGAPAHELVEREDMRWEVRARVDKLPPRQREVVDLSYFEELSHEEIAARLGVPLGTVKGRLRLALAKLRRSYGLRGVAALEPVAGAEPKAQRELIAA